MTRITVYDAPAGQTVYTVRDPADWQIHADPRFVHHRPSGAMFQIKLRQDLPTR